MLDGFMIINKINKICMTSFEAHELEVAAAKGIIECMERGYRCGLEDSNPSQKEFKSVTMGCDWVTNINTRFITVGTLMGRK
jgi:hypothetical protein